jgi:hypothetical protein
MSATTKSTPYYDKTANRTANSAPINDLAVDGSETVTTLAVAVNKVLAILRSAGDLAVN